MKKFWKYMMISAAAVALMPLAACDDNDEVDPYDINYAYIYQPHEDYSAIEFKANGDVFQTLEEPVELVPVRLTKPAPGDIEISVEIDPTLVDEYNNANGTDYQLLTSASLVQSKFTIARGEYITDEAIKVSFADKTSLINNPNDLILPIVIKSVTGGITISKSSRIFMIFKYKANMVSISSKQLQVAPDQTKWPEIFADINFSNFAYCDMTADEDIKISLEIDGSLVDAYNNVNGTGYMFMSDATLKSSTITIAQGENTADLGLNIGDYSQLETIGYVIPVRIAAVEGSGSKIEDSESVAYIVIRQAPPTIDYITTAEGTKYAPQDNWTITVNGSLVDKDGDSWASFLYYGKTAEKWVEGDEVVLDLADTKTITCFNLDFYAYYYAVKGIKDVCTSTDGVTWTSFGDSPELTGYKSSPIYKFSFPVEARYIRFTAGAPSWSASYGIRARGAYIYGN